MLSLFWDDTHHALAASANAWVARHIRPHADGWEEAQSFPRTLHEEAGAAGLLGVAYPEAVGGVGGDIFHALIVAEALIRGESVGTAMGLGSHSIALPPLIALGTPEQQQRWIPPVLAGQKVACLGVTEPGAGSDVAGIRTRAENDGEHYILNGSKTFITSGNRADLAMVLARTDADRYGGLTFFMVEAGTTGFRRGQPLKKMGWWASDTAELFFDDCRVPAANRVGPEGSGFLAVMANFANERLFLAASAVAVARLALERTEAYVAERMAFGRPLEGFQVIRHRVAEMATREAAARAHVAVVAEQHRRGEDVSAAAAMVKNHATDACAWVTDQAVQLHGGMGYMRECPIERLFRDQRLFSIGGGTSEIMRELISRRR